jgi:hypothetical protein
MYLNSYKTPVKINSTAFPEDEHIRDFKVKPLKKYFRPIFSPHMNSWDVDIGFVEGSRRTGYLFFINENTRFLFAWPSQAKNMEALSEGFSHFLSFFGHQPCYIKGDGERGFKAIADRMSGAIQADPRTEPKTYAITTNEEYKRNVHWWLKDDITSGRTHLTNTYCIVDSVIRTIRNLLGKDPLRFMNHNLFFQAVKVYNNTVHSAFSNRHTPKEMQESPELEMKYIAWKQRLANEARLKQTVGGYQGYQPGNILMIHIPWEKTSGMFKKQRRNFSELAEFLGYDGGNADVKLLKQIPQLGKQRLVIPVFYTKLVAKDMDDLEEKYTTQLL